MSSPCFDPINKIDCPDRRAGCAATCPKWAEHERQKKKRYAERNRKNEDNTSYLIARRNGMNRYYKDKARRKIK